MAQSNQEELRKRLTDLLTSMNHYRHTEPDDRLVEFINQEVLAVIDELEKQYVGLGDVDPLDQSYSVTNYVPLSAIQSIKERYGTK